MRTAHPIPRNGLKQRLIPKLLKLKKRNPLKSFATGFAMPLTFNWPSDHKRHRFNASVHHHRTGYLIESCDASVDFTNKLSYAVEALKSNIWQLLFLEIAKYSYETIKLVTLIYL